MNKKEGLKKIKFYNTWFKVLAITAILFFGAMIFRSVVYTNDVLFFIWGGMTLFMILSLGVITWGMIYHMVKGKHWGWFTLTIISFFFVGGFVIAIIFYFTVMKRKFKWAKFNYESGIFSKEIWEEEKK